MTFLLDQDVPDDLTYSLRELGYGIVLLRDVLPITSDDASVLQYAIQKGHILITCNRDDFLVATRDIAHPGIIIVIRRKTRAAERASLISLLDRAGETGISGNINFA
jgi:predicted nuclease of predicted toxin-antitoxin system